MRRRLRLLLYSTTLLLLSGHGVTAQTSLVKAANPTEPSFVPVFSVAVQMGTDIGGAAPVPLRAVGGAFNPYPKLNAAFGARLLLDLHPRWCLGVNINYKTVAMDADARVTNQKFKGENTVQYFTGTSEMSMSFSFLELPLYVDFFLGSKKQHALQAGFFGPYAFNPKFVTTAIKGFNGVEPDRVDARVTDSPPMDFSAVLKHWDTGLLFGYETKITSRVRAGLHLMFGVMDIFKKGNDFFDYKMHQIRGSIVLSYDLIRIYQR